MNEQNDYTFNLSEFEFNNECVLIDPYSTDLNIVLDKELLLAYPLTTDGFCLMWAGCKATHGVSSGRIVFEARVSSFFALI